MTDIFPESGIFLTILVISNARKPFISWSSFRNRQALFPDDIFKFQCWLDRSEGPHPPTTTDDDEEAPPTHSRSSRSRSKRQRSRSFGDRDTTDDGSEDAGEEVDELEENSKASDKLETEPEGGEGNGRRLDLHSDEREGNRRREPTPPPERLRPQG
ncbi:hypothetical protein EV363DRAFT_1459896 [Boletus edulis]|nr:hypothetical protein EV363DRAFT_1459896 [Boletus edulis]